MYLMNESIVSAVILAAMIIGFVLGRWLYRGKARLQTDLLTQEILRLRRRLGDASQRENGLQRDKDFARRRISALAKATGASEPGVFASSFMKTYSKASFKQEAKPHTGDTW